MCIPLHLSHFVRVVLEYLHDVGRSMEDAGDGNADCQYADHLKELHADANLFNHLNYFIQNLLAFKNDEGARLRLLQDPTAKFYLSSVYFSPEQADALLSFKGKGGRTSLEKALQSTIARKLQQAREGSSSGYEICTYHDLAPVFQAHFGVSTSFQAEVGNKGLYNKFAKEFRKKQGKAKASQRR